MNEISLECILAKFCLKRGIDHERLVSKRVREVLSSKEMEAEQEKGPVGAEKTVFQTVYGHICHGTCFTRTVLF